MRRRQGAVRRDRQALPTPGAPAAQAHPLLALQRAAGNGAVRVVVQRAPGPAPRAFGPRAGVIQPPSQGISIELGQTTWGAGSAPSFNVNVRRRGEDSYEAKPVLGRAGRPTIRARYPSPGLYPIGRSASGTIYGIVSGDISSLVRRGEQEHSDDAALSQRKVYGAVQGAVRENREPVNGSTEEDARTKCNDAVRDSLPPRLQWQAGQAPGPIWRSAVATVMAASVRRDNENWHSMTTARASYEENVRYASRLDQGDGLMRIEEGGEIGAHPSPAFVDEAYQERIESG